MPVASTSVDLGAELHLDADLGLSWSAALAAEVLAERAEHGGGGVEQDDAGPAGVDPAEVALAACGATSSAIWPAISTPVGPAPTTTKVISRSISLGVLASSAHSKAPKIRPRSSSASSIDFIPGAYWANWSLPK